MPDKCFFDTNILIYTLDDSDSQKTEIARRLVRQHIANDCACISFQVVQECLNVAIRQAKTSLNAQQAEQLLTNMLMPLVQVYPSHNLYQVAIRLYTRYQLSFYDALIIAAALEAGCKILYSEDLQHMQDIEGMCIINPFLS